MKHGDIEFHDLTGPVLDSIANEGLRIPNENGWKALLIEIDISSTRTEEKTGENKARTATPTSPSVFHAFPSFNFIPAINAGPR